MKKILIAIAAVAALFLAMSGLKAQGAEPPSSAAAPSAVFDLAGVAPEELGRLIRTLEDEMHEAAKDLRFEEAARLRDELTELKRELRAAG